MIILIYLHPLSDRPVENSSEDFSAPGLGPSEIEANRFTIWAISSFPFHEILLKNSEKVVNEPINNQTGWEIQKHECENDGHQSENLGLHRIHGGRGHFLLNEHGYPHDHRRDVIGIFG